MKRSWIAALLRSAFVLVLAAGIPLAACGGDDDAPTADAAAFDSTAGGDAPTMAPCGLPAPTDVTDVSVDDLHQHIVDGDPLAVVDVREPSETATGVIEGALLYPWNSGVLQADHADLPDDVPLFVICHSGGRSGPASDFLFANGHSCVNNVLGGMSAWTAAGYPTVSP